MKKYILAIKSIMPFCAALFIQGMIFLVISSGYELTTGNPDIPADLEYYIPVAAILICGLIFAAWYLKLTGQGLLTFAGVKIKTAVRTDTYTKAGIKRKISLINMLLLVPLGIGCQLFASGIISLISDIFVKTFNEYGKMMKTNYAGNPAVVVIYLVILAPVTEELIFRGVTMKKAAMSLTFMGANLLQATLFCIYHWNPVQSTYAFLSALLLGYILKKYDTLAAPIILHMVINASSFLIMLLPDNYVTAALLTVLGGALTVLCLVITGRTRVVPKPDNG